MIISIKRIRPSWKEYFFDIAKVVSSRATCPRASVGAVVVKHNRILATGYNGSPAGEIQCDEKGCLMENDHCIRTIHAEANAIGYAARYGVLLEGASVYIYDSKGRKEPCVNCTKLLKAAGIKEIFISL